ncbi:MAG: SusC/RagA family TonB-linked outer membrane protein [Longimicrobiales bacterium]
MSRVSDSRFAGLPWVRSGTVLACAALAIAAMGPVAATAQNTGIVRGTVVEAGSNRPLAGVQVFIKGTGRGTLSDQRGNFLLSDVAAGSITVRVESIGYKAAEQPVTVAAGQPSTANFTLQESAIGLDELVVTGTAGRTPKRALGNSVSSVKAEAITEAAPITNVNQLLQGRAAGVTLVNQTGVLGGSSKIRIRGTGSISASNNPVVYVDGIRVESGTINTEGNTAQGISALESFNPNDIESIEVIKGPAAATLYGADAAAGVIQIITKKGRPAEGLQWTASMEYGNVQWAQEQITTYWLCTDARMTALATNPGCRVFEGQNLSLEQRLLVDRPLDPSRRSPAIQHLYNRMADSVAALGNQALAEALRNDEYPCLFPQQQPCDPRPLQTGSTRSLNLSVRGGGESYNFYLSGEKNDEDGSFTNNYNNRVGGRANFGFVPSQKANFSVNVGYSQLNQQIPQSDNSSNSVLRNSYRGQAGGAASQYLPGFRNFHPEFSNKYNRQVSDERLTMAVTANYNPFGWWQNKLTVGLDRNDRLNTQPQQIDLTGRAPFGATAATGSISHNFDLRYLWTVDYAGTFTANLAEDWSSAFSAGMQFVKNHSEDHSISGNGLISNNLNLVSSAANRNAGQGFSEQNSLGFYMQELVGWRDRVFGTAAVRVDDNSAFGKDFSLVVYPKASVSWVISEEPFFNYSFVDELKLRAAWGQAGKAPAPFSADRTYGTGRTVIGDLPVNTLSTNDFGNADLKAETGSEIEAGFESSILRGAIGLDFTYFHRTTKGALLNVADPPSSGWTGNHLVNVGEIKNSGLELTINASPIRTPKVQWDVTAALGTVNNELVSFGRDQLGNPTLLESAFGEFASVQRHREGYPLGGYWATDVQRDANGVPILNASGQATPVTCVWNPADSAAACNEEFIGAALPTRTLGLTNTVRILNNLQLYAFFDYQGGHYQWCAICSVRTRIDLNTEQMNDPNQDPVERARLLSLQTKEFIFPADFIKLRELSATYTLPRTLSSRAGFSRAAITVSGRNLWLWTRYTGADWGGNTDPEVNFTSTSNFNSSDYGSIPMQRMLRVSLNFNF